MLKYICRINSTLQKILYLGDSDVASKVPIKLEEVLC
jgi:hypothetical protein